MAIRINEEHQDTGNGLGYQMTAYLLMRSLSDEKNLKFASGESSLLALKNTFSNIIIDEIDSEGIQGTNSVEIDVDESFESISNRVEDGTTLYGYPTPSNAIYLNEIEDIKSRFEFRQEIYERCLKWKKDRFGESEVISMHIRRGDYDDPQSGMFLIDTDYYYEALDLLPKDIPVLIFCNDKYYVLKNEQLSNLIKNPDNVLVEDIVSGTKTTLVDWEHLHEVLNDDELGLDVEIAPELNSIYLEHLIDCGGKNLFTYGLAIDELKSLAYERPPQCGEVCFETRKDCYKDKPDRTYADFTQYKVDNQLYNYSFDLCLMTMCDYHIMANSLYGFWGVALSNSKKIIYPKYWAQGMGDDPDEVRCDTPDSCRPGFKCNQDYNIVRDLDGFDQTKAAIGFFMDDKWVGLENPDQRVV